MKTADIEAEWAIAPNAQGRPGLASIVPGGSLTFEHRNIARRGRQVAPAPRFACPAELDRDTAAASLHPA